MSTQFTPGPRPGPDPAYGEESGNGSPTAAGAPGTADGPSIGELFGAISKDLSTLMRQEVELAKAEVRESATHAGKGAGMFAGAGVGAHMALLFLSIAAWWGIGTWTGLGWSAVIVAVIWAVIAAVLAATGRKNLKDISGLSRTAETAKHLPDAMTGKEDHR